MTALKTLLQQDKSFRYKVKKGNGNPLYLIIITIERNELE